jgi:uncharacterized phage-like protein YoqJ
MIVVAFTGHRPHKLGGYKDVNPIRDAIKARIKEKLIELKPDAVISGMALGVDQWAVEVCLELGIPFIAAVPFEGQEKMWPHKSKLYYHELLKQANEIEIISEGGYAPWKMQIRNEWMIDKCDVLIAVYDGTEGGTHNAFTYAEKINKDVYRIDPTQL